MYIYIYNCIDIASSSVFSSYCVKSDFNFDVYAFKAIGFKSNLQK